MKTARKYYIKTFGCQQNAADSERVAAALEGRGMKPAKTIKSADYIVVNTCMVRQSAENRVYGLIHNLEKRKNQGEHLKIIVTGCMVGVAFRDKSGKYLQRLKTIMPAVDEFMPIEEVGFDNAPIRVDAKSAWVPISNGCNNFCTFCIVPFTRGREISRPYEDIINECKELSNKGYENITLLGMNVNSYGADLVLGEQNVQVMRDINKTYFASVSSGHSQQTLTNTKNPTLRSAQHDAFFTYNGKKIKPIYVKHLGRNRIPTLFPYLLDDIAKMNFRTINFISSNPWDFSDELINVIAQNNNISRTIHFALQSGDDNVLRRMNRWYTAQEYLSLIKKMRSNIPNIKLTTDIIVGFCGETDEEFENTVALCKQANFDWAYISIYSTRPMTAANKLMQDDVPYATKKKRWEILDELINKPKLKKYSLHRSSATSTPSFTA